MKLFLPRRTFLASHETELFTCIAPSTDQGVAVKKMMLQVTVLVVSFYFKSVCNNNVYVRVVSFVCVWSPCVEVLKMMLHCGSLEAMETDAETQSWFFLDIIMPCFIRFLHGFFPVQCNNSSGFI